MVVLCRDVEPCAESMSEGAWVSARSDEEFLAVLGADLGRIQRMACVLVGGEAADDVVGEAIARTLPVWRAGHVTDCSGYLRRVVINLASRRWRRRALGRRRDHLALSWSQPASDTAMLVTERDRTLRAVMALPVRRRAVVLLRFYDDLSLERIAEVMGVTEGTVKSQLSRALKQLRTDLEGPEGT